MPIINGYPHFGFIKPVTKTIGSAAVTLQGNEFDHIDFATNATVTVTVENPEPGRVYHIERTATGTKACKVTFDGATINGAGNNDVTMNAQNEAVTLIGLSGTYLLHISTLGTPSLS